MSPVPTISATAIAHIVRERMAVHGAENSSASSTLDHREAGDEPAFQNRSNGRRRTDPSRIGTTMVAPLWNGPRLSPAFVAQVLGQIMMHNRPSEPARATYPGIAQIPAGVFFDTGV